MLNYREEACRLRTKYSTSFSNSNSLHLKKSHFGSSEMSNIHIERVSKESAKIED